MLAIQEELRLEARCFGSATTSQHTLIIFPKSLHRNGTDCSLSDACRNSINDCCPNDKAAGSSPISVRSPTSYKP
jgi:hypothetical protein